MFTATYRPKGVNQVIGDVQRSAVEYLVSTIKAKDAPQVVLLTGPSGVGKSTTAEIYSHLLMCDSPVEDKAGLVPCGECNGCANANFNISSINCASETGIEGIRDIISKIMFTGFGTSRKVYVLDEVHALSKPAQSALLAPLEKLPPHVFFIMATTEPSKIINTLLSRAMRFDYSTPSYEEQVRLVYSICSAAGGSVAKGEGLSDILSKAGGNVRNLVTLTEQYVRGAPVSISPKEEEERVNLITPLFYREPHPEEVFRAASKVTNYEATVLHLLRFCVNTLSRKNSNPDLIYRCTLFISLTGGTLPRDEIPEYAFYKLLSQYLLRANYGN